MLHSMQDHYIVPRIPQVLPSSMLAANVKTELSVTVVTGVVMIGVDSPVTDTQRSTSIAVTNARYGAKETSLRNGGAETPGC